MQKTIIISLICLIIAVVGISGCTDTNTGNETNDNLSTYANNSITFQYPSEWMEYSVTEDNEVITVGNYSTITFYSNESNHTTSGNSSGGIYVGIYKYNSSKLPVSKQLTNLKSHSEFKNQTTGNTTIDGITATTVTGYGVNDNGDSYKEKYVLFEKGDYAYAIIITIYPKEDYDSYMADVDALLSSFKFTG